jgi:hypothetical protein
MQGRQVNLDVYRAMPERLQEMLMLISQNQIIQVRESGHPGG